MNLYGRPTILTPSILEDACKVLSLGNYISTTCGYLGIDQSTWGNWINKGKEAIKKRELNQPLTDNEELYIQFYLETQKAQDEAVVRNLSIIQGAASKSWQAAAWILERRHSDMFALQQKVTIQAEPEKLTAADIRKRLEQKKLEENDTKLIEE